jgi:Protein of unknown function (DUF2752)
LPPRPARADSVGPVLARQEVALRWVGPVGVGVAAVAGALYVRAVDPASRGVFPACPFHRLTGWWCPGCGMTRGFHHLLTGDVVGALGSNLFLPVVVLFGGWLWLSSLWPALTGRRLVALRRVPEWAWVALAALAVMYGVLRNVPLAPFEALAP